MLGNFLPEKLGDAMTNSKPGEESNTHKAPLLLNQINENESEILLNLL